MRFGNKVLVVKVPYLGVDLGRDYFDTCIKTTTDETKCAHDKSIDLVFHGLELGFEQFQIAPGHKDSLLTGEQMVDRLRAVKEDLDLDRQRIFLTISLEYWNDTPQAFYDAFVNAPGTADLIVMREPSVDSPHHWGAFWSVLERLFLAGKVKYIGVRNYDIADLEVMKAHTKVLPHVNQITVSSFFFFTLLTYTTSLSSWTDLTDLDVASA